MHIHRQWVIQRAPSWWLKFGWQRLKPVPLPPEVAQRRADLGKPAVLGGWILRLGPIAYLVIKESGK